MVQTERAVMVVASQGEYVPIDFKDLKVGNVFMLYEPDGIGVGRFTALSDSYINDSGIWEIETQ